MAIPKTVAMSIAEFPSSVMLDELGAIIGSIHDVTPVKYGAPTWSQRDARWASYWLGNSQWTLGQRGCLVTALAMGITDLIDEKVTPGTLNAKLTDIGGYINGGDLVFNRITKLYPAVQFVELKQHRLEPAPAASIARWASEGQIVVALIDMDVTDPDVDQHWVLVTGGTEEVLTIHDPWPMPDIQQQLLLPPAYCRQDWDPARAIYAYARYGEPK